MGNRLIQTFFQKKKEKLEVIQISEFHKLQAVDIEGVEFPFEKLKSKKLLLIINVASRWGLAAPHYKQLCVLYNEYKYVIFCIGKRTRFRNNGISVQLIQWSRN